MNPLPTLCQPIAQFGVRSQLKLGQWGHATARSKTLDAPDRMGPIDGADRRMCKSGLQILQAARFHPLPTLYQPFVPVGGGMRMPQKWGGLQEQGRTSDSWCLTYCGGVVGVSGEAASCYCTR